ncbi:DUF1810 domain-containing protein [Rhodobacteraceae bacterium F11138]|nr:DUF1810 domain-containing protein [Rhodobacteraceae bacterium F11138]
MSSDWPDETDADLFLEAQDTVWTAVVSELTAGRKTSHWMWFVFPQLAELGRSDMSQLYGIHDLAEARAYLAQDALRERLVQVSRLILSHDGTEAQTILGRVDAKKLQSSMTLFAAVPDADPEFARVLDVFFDGQPCQATMQAIA